jgi:hypothetical protein
MADATTSTPVVHYVFNGVADFDSDGVKDSITVTKDAVTGQWQALITWMDDGGMAKDANTLTDVDFKATLSLSGDNEAFLGLTLLGDMDGDYNTDKLTLAMAPQMSSGGATEAWRADIWQGDYKKRLYLTQTATGAAHPATPDDVQKHGEWTQTATFVTF